VVWLLIFFSFDLDFVQEILSPNFCVHICCPEYLPHARYTRLFGFRFPKNMVCSVEVMQFLLYNILYHLLHHSEAKIVWRRTTPTTLAQSVNILTCIRQLHDSNFCRDTTSLMTEILHCFSHPRPSHTNVALLYIVSLSLPSLFF